MSARVSNGPCIASYWRPMTADSLFLWLQVGSYLNDAEKVLLLRYSCKISSLLYHITKLCLVRMILEKEISEHL